MRVGGWETCCSRGRSDAQFLGVGMEQIVKNDKIPITGSPRSRHERAKDKLLAVCEMGHDPSMKEVLGCTAAFIKFQRIIRLCMGKK